MGGEKIFIRTLRDRSASTWTQQTNSEWARISKINLSDFSRGSWPCYLTRWYHRPIRTFNSIPYQWLSLPPIVFPFEIPPSGLLTKRQKLLGTWRLTIEMKCSFQPPTNTGCHPHVSHNILFHPRSFSSTNFRSNIPTFIHLILQNSAPIIFFLTFQLLIRFLCTNNSYAIPDNSNGPPSSLAHGSPPSFHLGRQLFVVAIIFVSNVFYLFFTTIIFVWLLSFHRGSYFWSWTICPPRLPIRLSYWSF